MFAIGETVGLAEWIIDETCVNIFRDTMIICFGNCITSVVAGFAIFSVLGFLAKELGVDVKDVFKGGTGLAFVSYPDLVTRLPLPQLWAVLFFFMLFTLGKILLQIIVFDCHIFCIMNMKYSNISGGVMINITKSK